MVKNDYTQCLYNGEWNGNWSMSERYLSKEQRNVLVTYWDTLPIIKKIEAGQSHTKKSAIFHKKIMAAISKGVEDEVLKTKRRVLSANEIHQNLQQMHEEMTKSSLYYHLQKLLEVDQITIVMEVKTGKQKTAYYGRTAKLHMFLDTEEENNTEQIKWQEDLGLTLKRFTSVDENLQSIDFNKNYYSQFFEWIKRNEPKFTGLDIDLVGIAEMYNKIRFHLEYGDELNDLASFLNIDKTS